MKFIYFVWVITIILFCLVDVFTEHNVFNMVCDVLCVTFYSGGLFIHCKFGTENNVCVYNTDGNIFLTK
jgi:RsiW-degrading membrane proteinase PrsW (M82 family)